MLIKILKFLHIPLIVIVSVLLTLQHRDSYDWSMGADAAQIEEPPSGKAGAEYDLSSLHVLNSVLLLINQCYVEPDRMDPQKMLRAGLQGIENEVPEIIVEFSGDGKGVDVKVDTAQKTFEIGSVNSPWAMSEKL